MDLRYPKETHWANTGHQQSKTPAVQEVTHGLPTPVTVGPKQMELTTISCLRGTKTVMESAYVLITSADHLTSMAIVFRLRNSSSILTVVARTIAQSQNSTVKRLATRTISRTLGYAHLIKSPSIMFQTTNPWAHPLKSAPA